MVQKDEEKSELLPEESIAERVKLRIQKVDDEDLSNIPSLEGNEGEVKEGKGFKLLTRLPILLAQIKATNNSYKLKDQIRKIVYLSKQNNKITKNVYNK